MASIKVIKTFLLFLGLQTSKAQSSIAFKTDIETYAQLLKLSTLAVGVARGDSLIFFRGMGSASSATQMPITPDHIFAIASVTKSFTAVALQQLEAEGKISLTDLLDKYPNKYFTKDRWTGKTTLAHIISHTSESNPIGTNFIYNGSKYNLVFNAFCKINCEQGYKFDALMKLAKYFEKPNPVLSKDYLSNLIRYKEYINAHDNQYKEAKAMNSKL